MRRIALIQFIVALLVLFGVLGAYAFWYHSVGKASAQAAQLASEIRTKTEDSARVESAREALASLAEDEASIQGYLIRQQDIVTFLEGLESSGTTLGATVEVVSVSAETKKTPAHIALSLKISGSFDAVLRTLGSIEYGPYDSSVTGLTLDTVIGEDGTATWNAATTLTIGTRTTP